MRLLGFAVVGLYGLLVLGFTENAQAGDSLKKFQNKFSFRRRSKSSKSGEEETPEAAESDKSEGPQKPDPTFGAGFKLIKEGAQIQAGAMKEGAKRMIKSVKRRLSTAPKATTRNANDPLPEPPNPENVKPEMSEKLYGTVQEQNDAANRKLGKSGSLKRLFMSRKRKASISKEDIGSPQLLSKTPRMDVDGVNNGSAAGDPKSKPFDENDPTYQRMEDVFPQGPPSDTAKTTGSVRPKVPPPPPPSPPSPPGGEAAKAESTAL